MEAEVATWRNDGERGSSKGVYESRGVSIKSYGAESWLEKQIASDPSLLGLEGVRVVSTQVIHKSAGRLDILAKDEENEVARS